jgi:hypothetical protein
MELITSLRGPGLQLHLSRPSSPDSACYRKSRRADLRPRRALAKLRATPKQTILVRVAIQVQEKLAQDDDDEDMPVPELLDIRDLQGEIEAAVSP